MKVYLSNFSFTSLHNTTTRNNVPALKYIIHEKRQPATNTFFPQYLFPKRYTYWCSGAIQVQAKYTKGNYPGRIMASVLVS